MDEERSQYQGKLAAKDTEIEELRAQVQSLMDEKKREGREIERIKMEQERLDREYKLIEDSLGLQMMQKDQRIECMAKDIAFLQQSIQQER